MSSRLSPRSSSDYSQLGSLDECLSDAGSAFDRKPEALLELGEQFKGRYFSKKKLDFSVGEDECNAAPDGFYITGDPRGCMYIEENYGMADCTSVVNFGLLYGTEESDIFVEIFFRYDGESKEFSKYMWVRVLTSEEVYFSPKMRLFSENQDVDEELVSYSCYYTYSAADEDK